MEHLMFAVIMVPPLWAMLLWHHQHQRRLYLRARRFRLRQLQRRRARRRPSRLPYRRRRSLLRLRATRLQRTSRESGRVSRRGMAVIQPTPATGITALISSTSVLGKALEAPGILLTHRLPNRTTVRDSYTSSEDLPPGRSANIGEVT